MPDGEKYAILFLKKTNRAGPPGHTTDAMNISYTLIRSRRKTLSLSVTPEGVIVRAPLRMAKRDIDAFVASRRRWIESHAARMAERQQALAAIPPLTDSQLAALKEQARRVLPERVAHFAPLVGVQYGRITIRAQRTRWGSCSAKGDLSFNCLLLLTPPEVLDSVVVHELCHILEHNHSPRFYAHVLRVCPDYQKQNAWLKAHGPELMRRLGG